MSPSLSSTHAWVKNTVISLKKGLVDEDEIAICISIAFLVFIFIFFHTRASVNVAM